MVGNPLFKHLHLSDIEKAVLQRVGVRNFEELLSLVYYFPSLGQAGLDLAKLSNFAMLNSGTEVLAATLSPTGLRIPPPQFAQGALSPPGVPSPAGYEVPMPAGESLPGDQAEQLTEPIDLRLKPWAARDQGERGTCVAFAMTACREHFASGPGSAAAVELSEQFLYWATKTNTSDPLPKQDGTRIEFACQALAQDGICRGLLWPYNGTFNPAGCVPPDVSHESSTDPSAAAQGDAVNWRHATGHYRRGAGGGDAAYVLDTLFKTRRPVAVSVPVFRDPASGAIGDNWSTPVGVQYGRVLDPPPTSLAVGGHAVCVTGFLADATEATGGWFIFRNSWGSSWARLAPTPESKAPEPGYGYISATYIDKYLWEVSH